MSEIRVNKLTDEVGTGAPSFTYGCEVPVGMGITGDGGINIAGVLTCASYTGDVTGNASGTAGGLSGSPNITINNLVGVAATFSGVVTYEDVTNVDSIGIITARSYVSIADSIVHTGDIDTAIRFPSADTITAETGGSERLRVDSSGRVLVGTSSSPTAGAGLYGNMVIEGYVNTPQGGPHVALQRGQAATAFSGTAEHLGGIYFGDNAGGSFACVEGYSDGAAGANDYPGRLLFKTTADGASSVTERLRIDSSGDVTITDGDLVIGTAGHGIDFSAQTNAAGMTSELLDHYEEGTWTPGWNGTPNSGTWAATGTYTKIGNIVTIQMAQTSSNVSFTLGANIITGLPFTPYNGHHGAVGSMNDTSPSFGAGVLVYATKIYACSSESNITTLRITSTYEAT